jgi:hypothetical protein
MSVEQLRNALFYSSNDVVRDDAAEQLAERHWQEDEAQIVLFEGIVSAALDDSLKRTCAESLAEIWIRRNQIDDELYERLMGNKFREVIDTFLNAPKPSS